jgi:DNA-binding response OmpR family regulator
MPKGVLVATPHATFGELLRLSLEESGRYVVRTVTTAQEVLANGYRNGIELVILDSDLSDASVVEVGTRLRQKKPGALSGSYST